MTFIRYTCGNCGKELNRSAEVCPYCHARLMAIRCTNCGFSGSKLDFMSDHCPKCGSIVTTQPVRNSKRITLLIVIAVIIVLLCLGSIALIFLLPSIAGLPVS